MAKKLYKSNRNKMLCGVCGGVIKRCEVFELDHPLTQKDKKERIKRTGWTLPDKLHFVP